MLFTLIGIEVLLGFVLTFLLLGGVHVGTHVVIVVLQEGVLETGDGLGVLVHLSHGQGFAAESLAHLVAVVVFALRMGDSDFTLLNALSVLLHLEVDGTQVGVVNELLFVKSNSFAVESNGGFKVLVLVSSISLKLLIFSIFLALNLSLFLRGEGSLSLGLSLGISDFLVGFHLGSVGLVTSFTLVFASHLFLLHLAHVDAGQFLEDSVISGVRLHHLHEHLGVLNDHFVAIREGGISEHTRELGESFHSLEVGSRHRVAVTTSRGGGASTSHAGHVKASSSSRSHARVL